MAIDRLNRGDRGALDAEDEVDWIELARARGVVLDDARRLFDRACELVARRGGSRSDIARVYEQLLAQSLPRAPGRMTRTLRLQSRVAPSRGRRTPGKVALTSHMSGVSGLSSTVLRERLEETFGDGVRGVAVREDDGRVRTAEAITSDETVFRGRSDDDEALLRVGHEIAHAPPQPRERGTGNPDASPFSTHRHASLDVEAEAAGHALVRGAPFAVRGAAPSGVALFRGVPEVVSAGLPMNHSTEDMDPTRRPELRPGPAGEPARASSVPHGDVGRGGAANAAVAVPEGPPGHHTGPPSGSPPHTDAVSEKILGPIQGLHSGALPAATQARMEQVYGQRFDDVEIHADSAEVPAGQQAFARGRHIYFERGAFEPDTEHGEHVLAHELAHVAQQARPASDTRRPASRAALEADAHQAALEALAGRAASVHLFAPPSAALGFSNGEPEKQPASPASSGPAPGQAAKGAGRVPSGAPADGGPKDGSALHSTGTPHGGPGAGPGGPGARPAVASAGHPAGGPPAAHLPDGGVPNGGAPATVVSARRGAGGDLLVPEAPSALTPAATGRLHAIRNDNQGVAAATTQLPTAQQQTDVARATVEEPRSEQDARAQHDVVAGIDDRPPPSPEIEQACARIRQVIRDKRPPDEDKLVEAKPKEMAQDAGEQMSAGVEQRAGAVRQGYADMQQRPQGTPSTTPVPATLPPERAQTRPVDATAGAPDPLPQGEVSLDGDVAAQQQKIQDAGMNTEAGQLVKDGPIGDARGGADDLEGMAKTDPQKVLADQAAAITQAKGDMRALQAAADKALADARAGSVAHMAVHTTTVKGSEEQQRAAAGAQMQGIFTQTQQTIDRLLQPLSGDAVKRWEAGVAQLSTDFETSLAETKRKIDDRHSGTFGGVVGAWDGLTGLPGWVTEDYDRAEAKFGDGATSLITDISRDVNKVIEDCKKLIDQARKDIEAVVNALPSSLRTWAQGEADRLSKQLDQLSAKVDQTQHGLSQDLVNRANGAVQTVRERVADLREQAKGLIGKIAAAIAEFIKDPARAIVNGLLHLLGIPPPSFWALVDKLGNVISGIAADPMKFANTLMSGVGRGFQQFFDNLPIHLGQSLFQWLFSKMADAGIQMPLDFSMPSILTLVLEVMGITWPRITTILAKHIGAENTQILDQAHQLISTLINRGPLGVYHLVQEHLDPAMILDAIKTAAISYVMEAIITRVAARVIMMLNPAGAILQAIEALYRVIKWVIDNAARIFTLIEGVVNGAAQILAGNTSGVANLVERALGLLLVPVIDFLADYLGLSGIPNAIKKVIMGLQSKVEQILDRVIGFIVEKARALWQAIKSGGKNPDSHPDPGGPDTRTPEEKQRDLDSAVAAALEIAKQRGTTRAAVDAALPGIAQRFRLRALRTVDHGVESYRIHGEVNPAKDSEELPNVLSVARAITEVQHHLQRGDEHIEISVASVAEAEAVIAGAFPDGATKFPSPTPGGAYGSQTDMDSMRAFRLFRRQALAYHVDVQRYSVSEIGEYLDLEIAQVNATLERTQTQLQHVNDSPRLGRKRPDLRETLTTQLLQAQQRSVNLQQIRRQLSNRQQDWQRLEQEGVLYGHQSVDPDESKHRTNPHVNVEGPVQIQTRTETLDLHVKLVIYVHKT